MQVYADMSEPVPAAKTLGGIFPGMIALKSIGDVELPILGFDEAARRKQRRKIGCSVLLRGKYLCKYRYG